MEKIVELTSKNGVVIISKSSCCISYAVVALLEELGVRPTIHDIENAPNEKEMEKVLSRMGCNGPIPAVFIGGRLIGSINEVMSLHISGKLVPILNMYHPNRGLY